jgi:hypothetical protein
MEKEIVKLIVINLILVLLITLITLWKTVDANSSETIKKVKTYTYNSIIDPKQFFTYSLIEIEVIKQNKFILSVKSTKVKPFYAVNIIVTNNKNTSISILAYAYFDTNINLKYFVFNKLGNYAETVPGMKAKIMLKKKLYKLHKIQDI